LIIEHQHIKNQKNPSPLARSYHQPNQPHNFFNKLKDETITMSAKRKADDIIVAATASASAVENNGDAQTSSSSEELVKNHAEIMDACAAGELATVISLLEEAACRKDDNGGDNNAKGSSSADSGGNLSRKQLLAAQQDPKAGVSPMMLASQHGHVDVCRALLDAGAPWNAVDRYGKCAGDYATAAEKWEVVNLLVEAGTKAEVCISCVLMYIIVWCIVYDVWLICV